MLPGIQLKEDISFAKRRNAVWLSKSKCRITELFQDKLKKTLNSSLIKFFFFVPMPNKLVLYAE